MNIIDRMKAPTPKFFRAMRNGGLVLSAASAAILTAPVALPVILVSVAGYLAVAGAVATAVSQTAVESEDAREPKRGSNGGGGVIDSF